MTMEPTRRNVLSAGVASLAGATLPARALAEAIPEWNSIAERLTTAARARQTARRRLGNARDAVKRWGLKNPRPDITGDGSALAEWLERYKAALGNAGMAARHADYAAADAAHAAAAGAAVAMSLDTWADLRALGRLVSFDHANTIRDALHARVQNERGLA
jgi:hypothetical protein